MSPSARRGVRVAMFPDLVSTDPYSDLLDAALRGRGIEVERPAVLDRNWARAALGRVDAVHLHWLEFLFYSRGSRLRRLGSMYAQGLRVISALRLLRGAGVRVIWTVHNPSPHESGYPRLHRLLRRAVLDAAEVVVVHSSYAAAQVERLLAPRARVCVAKHGGYVGVYPPPRETRAQTRERLGIPTDAFVYLIFGHVREYKRVPEAIRAFRELTAPDARLLVVGAAGPPRAATEAAARGEPRVLLHLRSLGEDQVADVFQAADTLVLNYAEVFSSGALLLAQAFGLPVVAPAAGSAIELAPPPATIAFAEGGLLAALSAARRDAPRRRQAARAAAEITSWDETARVLEQLYRGERPAPPAQPPTPRRRDLVTSGQGAETAPRASA
jgi:beta-1,4-mannosyltransferase